MNKPTMLKSDYTTTENLYFVFIGLEVKGKNNKKGNRVTAGLKFLTVSTKHTNLLNSHTSYNPM